MARVHRVGLTAPPRLAPSTRAYMERKLACVEQKRSHPPSVEVLARVVAEMQSPYEQTRVKAVRQVCPCRLPWELFSQVRSAAKRLQRDPSPLVRAQVRHVEEDARELAALEALHEWAMEQDEGVRAIARRKERRGRRQQSRRRWQAEDEG